MRTAVRASTPTKCIHCGCMCFTTYYLTTAATVELALGAGKPAGVPARLPVSDRRTPIKAARPKELEMDFSIFKDLPVGFGR